MLGEKNDEMYLRHVQYGVFSPINRLHCSSSEILTKEPSAYANGTGEIAKAWLRLRHSLIPYLYTASYETHTNGTALIEPMYYEWKEKGAYEYLQDYRFGSQLLVFPVTKPRGKDGFARVKAWIPQGVWTDLFTGTQYRAGKSGVKKTLLRELEQIPVLVKSGGILPLSLDGGNGVDNPKAFKLLLFEGDGAYTLYEDGAETGAAGALFTHFEMKNTQVKGKCVQTLTIRTEGDWSVVPKKRLMKARFQNLPIEGKVRVYVDGKRKAVREVLADCPAANVTIEAGKQYQIVVEYTPRTRLQTLLAEARDVFTRANGEVLPKKELYEQVCACKTEEEFVSFVSSCKGLQPSVKQRLIELL